MAELGAFFLGATGAADTAGGPAVWILLVDMGFAGGADLEDALKRGGLPFTMRSYSGERGLILFHVERSEAATAPRPAPSIPALESAVRLLETHSGEPAVKDYLDSMAYTPDDLAGPYLRLAATLVGRGEFRLGMETLYRAVLADPPCAFRFVDMQRETVGAGDYHAMLDAVLPILEPGVRAAERLATLRDHRAFVDDPRAWSAIVLRGVMLAPGDADAWSRLDSVLREDPDLSGLIAELRDALADLPDDAVLHAALGRALQLYGAVDKAGAPLREALRLNPGLHQARRYLEEAPETR